MHGRLLLFVLLRRRVSIALLAAVLTALLGLAGVAFAASHQQFTLTVHVRDPDYVSAVVISSECCRLASTAVSPDEPAATFRLPRGSYIVLASPSPRGLQQHWYFVPTQVRLDQDQDISVQGNYGAS